MPKSGFGDDGGCEGAWGVSCSESANMESDLAVDGSGCAKTHSSAQVVADESFTSLTPGTGELEASGSDGSSVRSAGSLGEVCARIRLRQRRTD